MSDSEQIFKRISELQTDLDHLLKLQDSGYGVFVKKTGDTMTGDLLVSNPSDHARVTVNAAIGKAGYFRYQVNGVDQFAMGADATPQWFLYDFRNSTFRLFVTSSGYFGVNDSNPDSSLSVTGVAAIKSDANGGYQLIIRGASNANKQLDFAYNTTNNYGIIQAVEWNSGWRDLLLNPSGGNVSIGNTGREAHLTVTTPVASYVQAQYQTYAEGERLSGVFSIIKYSSSTVPYGVNQPNDIILTSYSTAAAGSFRFQINTESAHPLVFGTYNQERMRIAADGSVSIGGSGIEAHCEVQVNNVNKRIFKVVQVSNAGGSRDTVVSHSDQTFNLSGSTYTGAVHRITCYPNGTANNQGYLLAVGHAYSDGTGWNPFFTISSKTGDGWFNNNCSALSFTDRTPFYQGDAISEIRKIRGLNGQVDHGSLPAFARVKSKRTEPVNKFRPELGTHEIQVDERDLGAMISILTVAVQQLDSRITKLGG